MPTLAIWGDQSAFKKCSPFHYAASETSFGMPDKITERFLHGY
jgi:hypothetical protein